MNRSMFYKTIGLIFICGVIGFFSLHPEPTFAQETCAGPFISVSTPLSDLGQNEYQRLVGPLTEPPQYQSTGYIGGLYPNGSNTPPSIHATAAQQISSSIQPLDISGNPNPSGKIVLVSVGMSNTTMEFGPFIQLANADPQKNPRVEFINGAMSGATADIWGNPNHSTYPVVWDTFMNKFSTNTTPQQVQAAWVKLTQAGGDQGIPFPGKAEELQGYLRFVVQDLKTRFPNLKIVYFSSRARGYTYINGLSPEPNAYETAFSVRWLIEDQINGDTDLRYNGTNPPAPLLLWGPYLWINGTTPRLDGRTWPQTNLTQDCTHPSPDGTEDVAEMLLEFFKTNQYAANWFLADNITPPPTSTPTPSCSTQGNANCDASVNLTDLSIVLSNFGSTGRSWSQGDFDGNGVVNISDLSVVLSNFGTALPTPTTPPTNTPTPSTAITSTPTPTRTPTPTTTGPTPTPRPGQGFIIDHNSIESFEQIPDQYLTAARNLRMLFSDRSVGVNTDEALNCLTASSFGSAPSSCRRDFDDAGAVKAYSQTEFDQGLVPVQISFDPDPVSYNRSNWSFELKSGGWTELTQDFVTILGPQYVNSKDVLSYQLSYLNINPGGSPVDYNNIEGTIADPTTGFFADTSTTNGSYGIADLEAYWAQYPNKTFVLWTTSLARGLGSAAGEQFNEQMRQYARDNNMILFDFAAIESHMPSGQPCYDNRDGVPYGSENHPDDGQNYLAICPLYTTESEGGHLGSVSGGKIRVAKALWVLMARIAGWDGN